MRLPEQEPLESEVEQMDSLYTQNMRLSEKGLSEQGLELIGSVYNIVKTGITWNRVVFLAMFMTLLGIMLIYQPDDLSIKDVGQFPQLTRFCFISAKQSTNQMQWSIHLNKILSINYKNYEIIYFKRDVKDIEDSLNFQKDARGRLLTVLKSSGNVGEDYYNAIQNHCNDDSVIILLDQDEVLSNGSKILASINKKVISANPAYVWLFDYKTTQNVTVRPVNDLTKFGRVNTFTDQYDNSITSIQKFQNHKQLLLQIKNHVKVFKKQFYSFIPYIELMHPNQTFFNNSYAFLFPLIEMRMKQAVSTSHNSQFGLQVPGKLNYISDSVLYERTPNFKQFQPTITQIQQILQVGYKLSSQHISLIMQIAQQMKTRSLKFYSKCQRLNALDRKQPIGQRIPKKIHQIWVSGDYTQKQTEKLKIYKTKFMQKVKDVYHDYEYKLWTNQDLTPQNFPKIWTTIQELLEINKDFPYSRLSAVADLMKFEIIWNQGGIYMDTNYEPFRPLDEFLNYSMIIFAQDGISGNDLTPSVLGGEKHSKHMARLISPNHLASINLRGSAVAETGPGYYGKAFNEEDLVMDVKILPTDLVFPTEFWSKDSRFTKDRCFFPKQQAEPPAQFKEKYLQIIETEKYKLMYPCDKIYPGKYGIDHHQLGGSWIKPRW